MEFDFGSKGDIEFAAILEPADAPAAFGDRQTLWSAAEDAAMRCPFSRRLASLSSGEPVKPHVPRHRPTISQWARRNLLDQLVGGLEADP